MIEFVFTVIVLLAFFTGMLFWLGVGVLWLIRR